VTITFAEHEVVRLVQTHYLEVFRRDTVTKG
jgi:hypothetical protein